MLILTQNEVAETIIAAEVQRVVVLVVEMVEMDFGRPAMGKSIMSIHKSLPFSALQRVLKVKGSILHSQTEIAAGVALTRCGWSQITVNQHIEKNPSADHAERLIRRVAQFAAGCSDLAVE